MTIEEAIRHCEDVAAGETEQGKCPECAADHKQLAAWLCELIALRAQQDRTLDQSRWKGCDHCKGDLEGYTACFRDANGRSRKLYIPEGEAAIVVPGTYNHKFYIPIKYCPFCGRPLTEGAWAELERRIGGNDGTVDQKMLEKS